MARPRSRALLFGAALLILPALGAAPGRAADIVSGLSEKVIEIDARFTGTRVLLFGATAEPGDVVVVVRGPWAGVVVRRKTRIAGIWVNRESVGFTGIPRFYAVAATRPLDEIAPAEVLAAHRIGLEYLDFRAFAVESEEGVEPFREAVLRGEQQARLYPETVAPVEFMGRRLFRVNLDLPAKLPVGRYDVDIYVFEQGRIVARQTRGFEVRKTGLSARIFDFAHDRPWLYGLLAIASALVAGWLGGFVFRKA